MIIDNWRKPEFYSEMTGIEKSEFAEWSQIFADFFEDMKKKGLVRVSFGELADPDQEKINKAILKILDVQNRFYALSNKLNKIRPEKKTKEFVEKNREFINERDVQYLLFSQWGWTLIQTYEFFRNVLLFFLEWKSITRANGKNVDTPDRKSLKILLGFLQVHSGNAKNIEEILEAEQKKRNAVTHGLFWLEGKTFHWIEDVKKEEIKSGGLDSIPRLAHSMSLKVQCLVWVVGQLSRIDFFRP